MRPNKALGFTLIELLVVILILGLFSSLLAIRVEDFITAGDLRLASRVITGQIRKFRGMAAMAHKVQVLGISIGHDEMYPVQLKTGGDAVANDESNARENGQDTVKLPHGVVFKDVVIVSKEKVQDGEARIRFFPNGCVEKAMIHIKNQDDKVYTLEILPLTGQVLVHDGYVEQAAKK